MIDRPPGFSTTGTVAALVLTVFVSTGAARSDRSASAPSALPERVDQFTDEWMRSNGIPGLALAITRGTDIVHLAGYGDAGDGRPVTPDTQFMVASLSKSMTALAVLQLEETGLVDLDTPVQTYIADFAPADSRAADITVRMLLNQTSGLADSGFPEMVLPQPRTIADRSASLRDARLVDEPGSSFHYFNPHYGVLAHLVEVVSGEPFEDYLGRTIFEPLQMAHTASVVTSSAANSVAPDLARGHILVFGVPVARPELDGYLGGSGGVISTARDMANWLIVQSTGGRFQGHSVLSEHGIELMQSPPPDIETSYAMGWEVPSGSQILRHTGILSTFYAEQALLPSEDVGIVFMANAYNGLVDFEGLMEGLAALVRGESDPGIGFGARRIGITVAIIAVLVAGVGTWRLLRVRAWADRRRGHLLRVSVGIVGPLILPALVLMTPNLVARSADRVYGWKVLILAIPGLMGTLILAGVMGAALAFSRLMWIARLSRAKEES